MPLLDPTEVPEAIFTPLTTIFTPPESCSQTVYTSRASYIVGPETLTQCFPTPLKYGILSIPVVFSPGICPQGYKIWSPSITLKDLKTSTAVQTGYRCCPTVFPFTPAGPQSCAYVPQMMLYKYPILSTIIVPSTLSTLYSTVISTKFTSYTDPTYGTATSTSFVTSLIPLATSIIVPESTTSLPTTELVFTIWAPGLSLQFQSTDSEVVSWWNRYAVGASNSSLSTSTNPGNATSVASLINPSPSSASVSSSGTSAGAIAGIVVGVLIGFVLLLGALLLILRRRRRARGMISDSTFDGTESHPWAKSELDATGKQAAELDSTRLSELEEPKRPPVELPVSQVTSESPDQPYPHQSADVRVWNRT